MSWKAKESAARSLLHQYIKEGCALDVIQILKKYTIDLNLYNLGRCSQKDNLTPLHLAAYFGHFEVFCVLLKLGGDVNIRYEDGWTALHHCAFQNRAAAAVMLLANGIDVNAVSSVNKETALQKATQFGWTETAGVITSFIADPNSFDKFRCPTHFKIPVIPNHASAKRSLKSAAAESFPELRGFECVPTHILNLIFDYMQLTDFARVTEVCSTWRKVFNQYTTAIIREDVLPVICNRRSWVDDYGEGSASSVIQVCTRFESELEQGIKTENNTPKTYFTTQKGSQEWEKAFQWYQLIKIRTKSTSSLQEVPLKFIIARLLFSNPPSVSFYFEEVEQMYYGGVSFSLFIPFTESPPLSKFSEEGLFIFIEQSYQSGGY